MPTMPQKRWNVLGHLVTKHVRVDASEPASSKPLPPPTVSQNPSIRLGHPVATNVGVDESQPVPSETLPQDTSSPKHEDYQSTIQSVLTKHMPEDEAEAYAHYVGRRGVATTALLAKVLTEHESEDDISMIRCMLKDFGHNPRLMQLVLNDPKFVMALEEPLRGNRLHSHETKYSRALSAMEEAFTPAFRSRANEVPVDAELKKYGPIFKASVLTKIMHLNESAMTTFDEYEQVQNVRDNMGTIMKHLTDCKRSADIMERYGMMPTSDDMLEICDLLEEFPNSGETIHNYLEERKRFHMDELHSVVSLGSALAEGAL